VIRIRTKRRARLKRNLTQNILAEETGLLRLKSSVFLIKSEVKEWVERPKEKINGRRIRTRPE
jgi:hypothetical protein